MFFETQKITGDWLESCQRKGWTRDTTLQLCPQFEPLKKKLLALGGTAACIWDESDFAAIMERGQPFSASDAIMRRGRSRACHENSARLWAEGHNRGFQLCTGWAVSEDGMWRQHSWGLQDDKVVETTEPRAGYFGFVMTYDEARVFAKNL